MTEDTVYERKIQKLEAKLEASEIMASGNENTMKVWEGEAKRLRARVKELETNFNLVYREAIAGNLDSVKYVMRQLELKQTHNEPE